MPSGETVDRPSRAFILGGRPLPSEVELLMLSWLSVEELCQLAPSSRGIHAAVLTALGRVEELRLTLRTPQSVVSACRRLRSLEVPPAFRIEGFERKRPDFERLLQPLLASAETLRAVRIGDASHMGEWTRHGGSSAADAIESYRGLEPPPGFFDALLRCRNLTALQAPVLSLDAAETKRLVDACPNLTEITVRTLHPETLLSAGLPLRVYKDQGARLSEGTIDLLLGYSTLESVELYYLDHLPAAAVLRLHRGLAALPRLQSLDTIWDCAEHEEDEDEDEDEEGEEQDEEEEGEEGEGEQQHSSTTVVATAAREHLVFPALRHLSIFYQYLAPRCPFEVSGSKVERLTIQGDPGLAPSFQRLMEGFPSLTELRWERAQSTSEEEAEACAAMSPDVWSGLRKLRVFRLGRRFLSRVLFPRFSQLTDLSIAVGSRVAVPHTLAVLAKLQRLSRLRVYITDSPCSDDDDDQFSESQPEVLAQEAQPAEEEEETALFSLPHVEHRALRALTVFTEETSWDEGKRWSFAALFDRLCLPGLETLFLEGKMIAEPAVDLTAVLQRACPSLRRLTLENFTEATLQPPRAPFANLEEIECYNCPLISDGDIRALLGRQ